MTTGIAKITKIFIGGETQEVNILSAFAGEEVFAETKDLDFNAPNRNKLIAGLVFSITERGNIDDVSFYIGGKQFHNDTITWYGPYSLADADNEIWFQIPKYKLFRLKIVDVLPVKQWKLSGIEIYGKIFNEKTGSGPRGRV